MEKEISCRIVKLCYDYVALHKGEKTAAGLLENLPHPEGVPLDKKALIDEHAWVSFKLFLEIADRVAKLFNDDNIFFKIEMEAGKMRSYGLMDILLRFVYPTPAAFFQKFPQMMEKNFNKISVIEAVKTAKNSVVIKTRNIDRYFPTDKYTCSAARGAMIGITAFLGYGLGYLEEPECSVPIDRKGVINGKFYKVNDQREVFEFERGKNEGRLIGELAADGSFRLGGTVYGAKNCVYHVSWPDRSLWARTFGLFFDRQALLREAVRKLEENKIVIEQKYKELDDLNATLEEKVRRRTAELEHSNKLKDLFISIMDHDIKNYLTSILGYSFLLIRRGQAETLEYGRIIKESANKINELISSARTFSIIQDVDLEKKKIKQDLSQVLETVLRGLKLAAEQKQIELAVDVPADKYFFDGLALISDVFLNLIDNAIKYSEKNAKIEIYAEDRERSFIFCVRDHGRGVPDGYKETIFKRFERIDYHKREGVEGSGLGLAIVRNLVSIHHGRVWVEDGPGGGAIFKVELKRSRQ